MTAERRPPMAGYDAATYGDRFADVYDAWYGDLTDTAACVSTVADLAHTTAGDHRPKVLELGVGTGRLAIPLAARGIDVTGVDSSSAMLDAMSAKPGAESIRAVLGDMTDTQFPSRPDGSDTSAAPRPPAERGYDVVLIAYNTLFNLVGDGEQQRCLRGSAGALVPGGSVVIEAFVPASDAESGDAVTTRQVTADRVVLSVSRTDVDGRLAMGQYVDISEEGIKLRPWQVRWATPDELDSMAGTAGLELHQRWSDWMRTPFTDDATAHISVYRRPS